MRVPTRPTPTRIPPTQTPPSDSGQGSPSPDPQAKPTRLPTPAPAVSNLATDAYALQAQLDQLAQQFDGLKSQLRQSQKLATLGTTAAMIAHELNNMLTPIVAYARDAIDRDDQDLMRIALTKTLDRAAVMRGLLDRVIGLARQPDTVIKSIQVRAVVAEAIGCLGRNLAKDNIQVNIQVDEHLSVRANESQLLQVLFNLITNARQAMLGRRGRLAIDAVALHDQQVQINVRDNGCGIAPENLGAVFDPFFSTHSHADKPDQRGLGLGLPICRDIIEELGGEIDVESQVGTGTTFIILLPEAD